jgi:hypothetical protein
MRTRSLLALLLGPALLAQTPPCASLNDANTSVGTTITAFGFGGPGVYAWQFTPANALVLQAAELFTNSTPFASPRGYMTLEIWDTNLIMLPQSRLGGGTWQNQPNPAPSWQGASFDTVVVLNANQTYWLVWRESGGNRLPYEPGGVTATTAKFVSGNWVLQAISEAPKWRAYCSLLDDANVLPVGSGCLSSLGFVPAEFTNNAPAIGNLDFQFEGTGFPPGSIGLAVLGTNAAWVSIPIPGTPVGCLLHTDPLVTATVLVGTGNQQALHTVGASGHVWVDLPIPLIPTLAGTVIGSQFAILDPGSTDPLPFVFSNGLRITLF